MALSSNKANRALIAFQRFGLGAKANTLKRVAKDAEAALIAEVKTPGIARIRDKKLPSYKKAASQSQKGSSNADSMRRQELEARIKKHMDVDIGFVERLVMFWSNHFSMSIRKKSAVRGMMGQLERDVIRQHVLGDFSKMLIGVTAHPAMLAFLDNEESIGPNSKYGREKGAGFNENLAREIMELHTIGTGGGYTEEDVTSFALILTGWSYVRGWEADHRYNGGNNRNRGKFVYRRFWHEPGSIELMGKKYRPEGQKQGLNVLRDLAKHPSTAEHIAFKLVRHFITDEPTPEMVEPLKKRFIATRGDLKQVALALIGLPEAFSAPLTKIRTPYELAIAQYRAVKQRYPKDDYWTFESPLRALNHVPWECPTPDGYPDETLYWLDPDSMTLRLDTALLSGKVFDDRIKGTPAKLASSLYDSALSKDTRERVAAGSNVANALAILFSSPEFQRR